MPVINVSCPITVCQFALFIPIANIWLCVPVEQLLGGAGQRRNSADLHFLI